MMLATAPCMTAFLLLHCSWQVVLKLNANFVLRPGTGKLKASIILLIDADL
jgi:hypothetical protein